MKKANLPLRTANISSFIVMDVLERAQELQAQGRDIIHLEVGEPDFPTPVMVKETALRALEENDTHYTHSLGKIELREEIARHYWEQYGVSVSPEQIIVTSGTSPAMLLVFSVLLEQGREVILPNPYYACYPNFVNYLQGRPVFVNVEEENAFQYLPAQVKKSITPSTAGIVVNSPANPTGMVASARDLQDLAEVGPMLVSDEIYHGLVYEGEQHSILEYTDQAFVINGFSKLYAMTGWRLGYVIAPKQYVGILRKLQQNLFICAASFAQTAGVSALRDCSSEVAEMIATYNQRRIYLLQRLKEMGIACVCEPTGAFYALANVKKYTCDSYRFAFDILEKAGVAVTPGIDFGSNCEGYIRFSYANSLPNIKTGLERIEAYLKLL